MGLKRHVGYSSALIAFILSIVSQLFIIQTCLISTPTLAFEFNRGPYLQTSLPQFVNNNNNNNNEPISPNNRFFPFFTTEFESEPISSPAQLFPSYDDSSPADYFTPLISSPQQGDIYFNERYEEVVDRPMIIGVDGKLRRDRVPETVLRMIRRGAIEDSSVTKYQKNKNIPCPSNSPCKKAHETSFKCKCSRIHLCWAPGKFNDATCKFTAPPFGVKFYQP